MTEKADIQPPMAWRRVGDHLAPACERSAAFVRRLKDGDLAKGDFTKSRSLGHHRKYWKLLAIVVDNSDAFDSPEQVHLFIKATLGRGTWWKPEKATRAIFIPDSTSFGKMDQEAFQRFYNEAVQVIIRHMLPHLDADQLDAIVENFA